MGHEPLTKTVKTTLLLEVAKFGIRSVLRHHLKVERHVFVAVLVLPPTTDPNVYHDAALTLLKGERPRGDYEFDNCRVDYFSGDDDVTSRVAHHRFSANEPTIVLLRERCELSRSLALALDVYADIPPPSARHFLAAARQCGIYAMTSSDAQYLATLSFYDIKAAMPVGRPFLSAVRRLREVLSVSDGVPIDEPPRPQIDLAKMDQVVGHTEIKEWATTLAEDVVAWQDGKLDWIDVDKGAVITGPSGTGKTRLARAIAEACGVRFVATSAARWQARGHLGDYLKALRQVFADAQKSAPCILFIDEMDAVGDRNQPAGDNELYVRQAIAGLLEVLDGSDGREGVVVIAATNNVSVIDPALLRPGRLERVFHVGLPDEYERRAILGHHVAPFELPQDIQWFDDVSEGMSGADLDMVARNARRIARRGAQALTSEHLLAAMPALRRIDEGQMRRNSIHEAGHAVLGAKLEVRHLMSVSVSDFALASRSPRSVGQTRFESERFAARDRQQLLDEIAMLLGGMAAEEIILGSFSDGSGGIEGSDLVAATDIATIIQCQLGMGFTMISEVGGGPLDLSAMRRSNPIAWRHIDETIRTQFERAKSLVQDYRPAVELVAAELLQRKRLSGNEVRAMLAEPDARTRPH